MTGAWRARVTRIKDGRPYVVIPRLAGEQEFGPLEILEGPWSAGLTTQAEGPGGAGEASFAAHSHGLGVNLARDDRVLVQFLEGNVDDPVIVGRLA